MPDSDTIFDVGLAQAAEPALLSDRQKELIAEYLDEIITHWRVVRAQALLALGGRVPPFDPTQPTDQYNTAICYVDAIQSVRSSLLGAILPAGEALELADEATDDLGMRPGG